MLCKILLWVILLLAALLGLICLLRVGGSAEYTAEGLQVRIKVGPLWLTVYPLREKSPSGEKKAAEKKKGAEKEKEPKKRDLGGSLKLIKEFLPLLGKAAGGLRERIRIDELSLTLILAGGDPAAMALSYGAANAVYGMIWPVFEQNFTVCDHSFRTGVDFTSDAMTLRGKATFTARIGQLLSLTLRLALEAWKRYRKLRPTEKRQKEANRHGGKKASSA